MVRVNMEGLTTKEFDFKYRRGQTMDGRLICGAKSKRSGKPCIAAPMDNGRCRMHGGMNENDKRYDTPSRNVPGRPLKSGRYSKYLKYHLADKYEDFIADKDITSLRDDLAQTRALLIRMAEKIDITEGLEKEDVNSYVNIVEQVRRLSETHTKIEASHKYSMSPEEVKRSLAAVAAIIFKYVEDEDVRAKIAKDISEIRIL